MKNDKTTIKQSLSLFGISRTTLYKYLNSLNTKPKKEGKNPYLTNKQINDIKGYIDELRSDKKEPNKQSEQTEQVNIAEKIYKEQINELKKELETKQEKIEGLIQEVGQWQGRASTLEEQNIKLLEQSAPEDKRTIVDAEVIESEPTPPKKAEKIGIFQKIINFRF
jgi:predicted  nucleic acid-binding Zn-ribbon protein